MFEFVFSQHRAARKGEMSYVGPEESDIDHVRPIMPEGRILSFN